MSGEPVVEMTIVSDEVFMMHHRRIIRRWIITLPGANYRAEINECPCGLRRQIGLSYAPRPADMPNSQYSEIIDVRSVPMIECLCKYEYGRCTRATAGDRDRRCHGWHEARVERLLGECRGLRKGSKLPTVTARLTACGTKRTLPAKLKLQNGQPHWFDELVST